jgi:ribose transport system permease protein
MIQFFRRHFADYGMILVLLLLCVFFSFRTMTEQSATGADAGEKLAGDIARAVGTGARVMIAVRDRDEDAAFADALSVTLAKSGATIVETVKGEPRDARAAMLRAGRLDVIACNGATAEWAVFSDIAGDFPALGSPRLMKPAPYRWPNFLKTENLLNIANQIAVIAITAVGMTIVIITAGIDLSVGSLIALSAVVSASLIVNVAGATNAGPAGMTLACLGGIAVCGLVGAFSGAMITLFSIPPFIATLAMMLIGNGVAYILAKGGSVYQLPDSFVWLGRGEAIGLPNAVVLMLVLYIAAHVLMSRMKLGRYIYAVGGNREAARLSGVPVRSVLLFAYAISGLLAGLGGVVMASQLKSGSPTYGQMYELYVIAAVVVGGTSLSGGEGKMFGTLIGAFIIAVIQNGMNLTNVEPYTQKVVLGAVILLAVLLDRLKRPSGA